MTETAQGPRISIDVPPGLAGLPVTGQGAVVAAHIHSLASDVAAQSGQPVDELERHLGSVAHYLAEQDVLLIGRFATSDDRTPDPILATLSLAMAALDMPEQDDALRRNRTLIAAELVRRYRQRHPKADARIVELASGPALVAQSAGDHHIPAKVTGGAPVVRPEFKAEFQLPAADGGHLAVLVVTTESEAGWPLVAAEAARIANSIRLAEPDAAATGSTPN